MIRDNFANQLIYSTVRLECYNDKVRSRGTAFFMIYEFDNTNITALITNKHVVCEDDEKTIIFKKAKFVLSCSRNGSVADDETTEILIDDLENRIVFHDNEDVDLCFIFVNDLINEKVKSGINVFYKALNTNLIISDIELNEINPIEDIIMIGYPTGLIDVTNNKPIVRKGITATSYKLDYNGKKEFLIDAACFYGSSGSPVFLYRSGLGQEKTENGISISITFNYRFIGVLYAGPTKTINGEIKVIDIPCRITPYSETKIMINLGYIIKPCRIIELFEKVKNSK